MADRTLPRTCTTCAAAFDCSPDHEATDCWCHSWPPLLVSMPERECLCPQCFGEALKSQIEALIASVPRAERRNNPLFVKHASAGDLLEGLDFYREPGFTVFTEWYHLKRGECCGSGCRHCPY